MTPYRSLPLERPAPQLVARRAWRLQLGALSFALQAVAYSSFILGALAWTLATH